MSYSTDIMGILFKVMPYTMYFIFWASYFVRMGPRERQIDPQKELNLFTQPVTEKASLVEIGSFV